MEATVLVVEDDPAILRGLEMNLQIEGFRVLTATNGSDAIAAASRGEVDLVVLDIMMPHANGYQVCRALRDGGNDVPIILLSARNAEQDIVMGLDLGADDYVTKPFALGELLARIKAQLRRRTTGSRVTFADVEVDLERKLVQRDGTTVELGKREYELLALLISREGAAVTREAILAAVWGRGYFGTDRTVDNYITRLRQKLEAGAEPKHIVTVRGIGYRFLRDPS
jgi:DNA-binding response OmpR family regulator